MSNVTALPKARRSIAPKPAAPVTNSTSAVTEPLRPSTAPRRDPAEVAAQAAALRRQRASGAGVLAVATLLTGVSLGHLAHGIDAVAHVGAFDARSTALGIDAGFIALETAALCATGPAAGTVQRWSKPAVAAMMGLSAVLNLMAYSAHAAPGVDAWISAGVGMALPVAIYVCTRVGFATLTGEGA